MSTKKKIASAKKQSGRAERAVTKDTCDNNYRDIIIREPGYSKDEDENKVLARISWR